MLRMSYSDHFSSVGPSINIFKLQLFRISNDFSSGASGPMLLKFHLEPHWGREMKDC